MMDRQRQVDILYARESGVGSREPLGLPLVAKIALQCLERKGNSIKHGKASSSRFWKCKNQMRACPLNNNVVVGRDVVSTARRLCLVSMPT